MKKPFVLGLDLDNVTADYDAAFREKVASYRNVDPSTLKKPHDWSFAVSGWTETEEEFRELHHRAVKDNMFLSMPVMQGASEALWELSDAGVFIRIVTHRLGFKGLHGHAAAQTVQWLDNHNIPYRDLCFVADKPQVGADVYVDDAPHNLDNLAAIGANVICFDALYNQHLNYPRAHNWSEVKDMVLQLHENWLTKQ